MLQIAVKHVRTCVLYLIKYIDIHLTNVAIDNKTNPIIKIAECGFQILITKQTSFLICVLKLNYD